jgi:hypothetical protein
VMNCVFLPSLDAVGETCRAFIHVSSADWSTTLS